MRAAAVRYGPVFALTLLGAVLRFPTLDRQSFWLDELVTASLLDRGLGDVLREIPRTEATPYLYYVVAWLWSSVFGLGEVGLRSLSALAGTATIPVAYGAGVVLVSRRAGIVAAALVATSPFLVWYSQEARSYALFALLGATSVLTFGLALRGDRRWLAGWAVVCALALATHYFGVFLVAAEAVWLLVAPAAAAPGRAGVARPGRDPPRPSARAPRPARQRRSGRRLVARGADRRHPEEPRRRLQLSARGRSAARSRRCLVLVGARPRRAARARERRGALVAGSLAAAVVLVPVVLALVGVDFLIARNTIVAVVPAAVCVGAGFAAGRLGIAAAARPLRALRGRRARAGARPRPTAAPTGAARPRRSARRDGRARDRRHAVHEPDALAPVPAGPPTSPSATARVVREIARSASPRRAATRRAVSSRRRWSTRSRCGASASSRVERKPTYTLVRYRATGRRSSRSTTLAGLALTDEQPGILLQGP